MSKTVLREHIPSFVALIVLLIFTVPVCVMTEKISAQAVEPVKVSEVTEVSEVSEPTTEYTTAAAEREYIEVTATLTAYCPCVKCCGKSDGITASGTQATAWRTVAVDTRLIPYGTEISIDGKTYVAEDCGGKVKGYTIDVFFNSHEEALNFGRQTKTVKIYKTVSE